MSNINDKKILLDSDVIRNFIRGNRPDLLPKIFPESLVVVEQVYDEICRDIRYRKHLKFHIEESSIELMDFPYETEILNKYENFKEIIDDGESACLAVAKFYGMIVASSNMKQIKKYCDENKIEILPTMEILIIAENKKILTPKECDDLIKLMISNGGWLPCNSLQEYKDNYQL